MISNKDIHTPKAKLESSKKQFQYTGIQAWISIPTSTRELSSLGFIKKPSENTFYEEFILVHAPLKERLPVRLSFLFLTHIVLNCM